MTTLIAIIVGLLLGLFVPWSKLWKKFKEDVLGMN